MSIGDCYVGRCRKCEKVIAASIAHTIEEKIEGAKEVKIWLKTMDVELESYPDLKYKNWCSCK